MIPGGERSPRCFKRINLRRIWVQQEIGLAAKADMFYGNDKIDWNELHAILGWIDCFGTTDFSVRFNIYPANFLRMKTHFLGPIFQSFPQRRGHHRTHHCSDARDRIFACLGHPTAYDRD
jgi:hypothetical protein